MDIVLVRFTPAWHAPTRHLGISSGQHLGITSGQQHSFKPNTMSPHSAFPSQTLALKQDKCTPTDHNVFDGGATDAFYKLSTTIACTLLGAHLIIKAIQPDGSMLSSTGKKSISLLHTSLANQNKPTPSRRPSFERTKNAFCIHCAPQHQE